MEKLISKPEVCEYLAISRNTLDRIINDGSLPIYRVRGQVRFRRKDVEQYLERCKEQRPQIVINTPRTAPVPGRPPSATPRHVSTYVPGMKVV